MPEDRPLEVWTARISTRDPDALNVTRKSGVEWFAPSWPLLRSALVLRREARSQTETEWKSYMARYLKEMEVSYKTWRQHWDLLLARPRVVLTCYCTDPDRCHRKVLALILVKLGAVYRGELRP